MRENHKLEGKAEQAGVVENAGGWAGRDRLPKEQQLKGSLFRAPPLK